METVLGVVERSGGGRAGSRTRRSLHGGIERDSEDLARFIARIGASPANQRTSEPAGRTGLGAATSCVACRALADRLDEYKGRGVGTPNRGLHRYVGDVRRPDLVCAGHFYAAKRFDDDFVSDYTSTKMTPLKAHVRNGRLVMDEPTELPEGEVIYLRPSEAGVGDDDGFDDQERAALHHAIDQGLVAARAGDHADAEQFTKELLARA